MQALLIVTRERDQTIRVSATIKCTSHLVRADNLACTSTANKFYAYASNINMLKIKLKFLALLKKRIALAPDLTQEKQLGNRNLLLTMIR